MSVRTDAAKTLIPTDDGATNSGGTIPPGTIVTVAHVEVVGFNRSMGQTALMVFELANPGWKAYNGLVFHPTTHDSDPTALAATKMTSFVLKRKQDDVEICTIDAGGTQDSKVRTSSGIKRAYLDLDTAKEETAKPKEEIAKPNEEIAEPQDQVRKVRETIADWSVSHYDTLRPRLALTTAALASGEINKPENGLVKQFLMRAADGVFGIVVRYKARQLIRDFPQGRETVHYFPALAKYNKWKSLSPPVGFCPICDTELDILGIDPTVSDSGSGPADDPNPPKSGRTFYCGHLICNECYESLKTVAEGNIKMKCPMCRRRSRASRCRHYMEPIPIPGRDPAVDSPAVLADVLPRNGAMPLQCPDCVRRTIALPNPPRHSTRDGMVGL
ncbi:hypothetical protein OQA88_5833 [Cercophora sp. LCS_1]